MKIPNRWLEPRERWSRVPVEGANDLEGWGASKHMAKV